MNTGSIQRICVVRFGGLGDILMTTPSVRALHEQFPQATIDYIVGPKQTDTLSGVGYIDQIIEWDNHGKDAHPRHFAPFLLKLRAHRYDLFVNFQRNAKTVIMALASGARVLTYHKKKKPQPDTGHFLHTIDNMAQTLAPLGINNLTSRHMDFHVPEAARIGAAATLLANGVAPNEPFVVLNPSATREINRWPVAHFASLVQRTAASMPRLRFVVIGGGNEDDRARAQRIVEQAAATRVVDLSGKLSLKELGALLARADAVVTNDTGPLHIASAVGARIVCLSGAADPDVTGPTSPRDLVVINRDLPCVPCRDRKCRRGDIACMNQLSPEGVFQALCQRLSAK